MCIMKTYSYIHMEEGMSSRRNKQTQEQDDTEHSLKEFRRPRNLVISVVAHFYSRASARLRELKRHVPDVSSVRIPELLDARANIVSASIYLLIKSIHKPSLFKYLYLSRHYYSNSSCHIVLKLV